MRISEVPGYGIGLLPGDVVVFITSVRGDKTRADVSFIEGGALSRGWVSHIGCGYRRVSCPFEETHLIRFWQLDSDEVTKIQKALQLKLLKTDAVPF